MSLWSSERGAKALPGVLTSLYLAQHTERVGVAVSTASNVTAKHREGKRPPKVMEGKLMVPLKYFLL